MNDFNRLGLYYGWFAVTELAFFSFSLFWQFSLDSFSIRERLKKFVLAEVLTAEAAEVRVRCGVVFIALGYT